MEDQSQCSGSSRFIAPCSPTYSEDELRRWFIDITRREIRALKHIRECVGWIGIGNLPGTPSIEESELADRQRIVRVDTTKTAKVPFESEIVELYSLRITLYNKW